MGVVLPVVDEDAQMSCWAASTCRPTRTCAGTGRCKPPAAGSLAIIAALDEGEPAKVVTPGDSVAQSWGTKNLLLRMPRDQLFGTDFS
ncbi:unnamed protein product [Lampetra fluviatilis]